MKDKTVQKSFTKQFGTEFRFFAAPGRINLIGEHTDYNDGFVLPGAIDRRIYLAIHAISGTSVTIHSVDYDETVEFDLTDELPGLPHWARYPFGVIKEFQKKGFMPGAFQASFGGDIPDGAGLSSSAALESVFSFALNTLFEFGLDKMAMVKIGQLAEHNYAGVRCGIMDQFASIHGKSGYLIRLDCRSLDYEYYPLELGEYELILADTRVKHSLASSEYNRRRQDCEEGVLILRSQMPAVRSLRDVRSKDVYGFKDMMGKQIFLRCQYVAEEIERVLETCHALENGDLKRVGALMYQTHHGLRTKYEVSCDELDVLVDTAKALEGVLGARMMGGGFGGCTINLIAKNAVEQFKKASSATFQQAFGTTPEFYEVNIGDGAREMRSRR